MLALFVGNVTAAVAQGADSLAMRLPLDSLRGAVFGTTWGDGRATALAKARAYGFTPPAGQDSRATVVRGAYSGHQMVAYLSFAPAGAGRVHLEGTSLLVAVPLAEMHRVYCAEWWALTRQRHLTQRPVAESGCSAFDHLDVALTGPLGIRREVWRGAETHHEAIDLMASGPRSVISLVILSPDASSRWVH
jgi:hypothetical protein